MVFASSVGDITGPQDIEKLGGKQLVDVFNEIQSKIGGSLTKRFADNTAGRTRCVRAYHEWRTAQKADPLAPGRAKPMPKPVAPVSAPSPSAKPAGAKQEKADPQKREAREELLNLPAKSLIRTHKPSTNRGKVIIIGSRAGGVTMQELQTLTGWVPQQVRSCLRQINAYSGHGIEETSANVFVVTGKPQGRKRMNWPPKGEIRPHRKGTKRDKALSMCKEPNGASFEEIKSANQWNDIQAYEGIKLLHGYLRYGIKEDEEGRIRAYTKGGGK